MAVITRLGPSTADLIPAGSALFGAALTGAVLVAVLAIAAYYDPLTRQALTCGGEVLRLPAALATALRSVGWACDLFATALLSLADSLTAAGRRGLQNAADGAFRAMDVLMPRFEDRYYVGATLLLAIAAALAFVG